jgi:ribosomal protein L3 glutamine methyltransferase
MAMEELPPEYAHEPQIALAGGDDGLDAVRTIVTHSAQFLNPDGVLVVEVGRNREAAEAAFPRLPFTWLATTESQDCVFLLKRDDLLAAA